MLFEKITYQDDFPINVTIASLEEYPVHYHQDIEFIYVLKGRISLKNGYCIYTLREGDIFVNAGHEIHSMYSVDDAEKNVVALIQISTRYFSQYFPDLGKACYRTYSKRSTNPKLDHLREIMLQIILKYNIRSFNYKHECIRLMKDVIEYLDRYFNLFTFEGDTVINAESMDQITTDRLSRIINYIYQNYAEKIKLEELADMEHLSMFYVSHIIKNCTGMSFREFLCFARVERSEILLLDTNQKVSQIAKAVGFSTTAYYEKYFIQWYKRTPEEHRQYYQPLVKSDTRQEKLVPTAPTAAIHLIKNKLSALNAQENNTSISRVSLEVNISKKDRLTASYRFPLLRQILDLQVTLDDFKVLGTDLPYTLKKLRPGRVSLLQSPKDDPGDVNNLYTLLTNLGFVVRKSPVNADARQIISFGNDTVAYPINLLNETFYNNRLELPARLRDPAAESGILRGYPAMLTSSGIRKPSYYAYLLLSRLTGQIIARGKYYCVIRATGASGRYFIVTYHYNDDIYNMCKNSTSIYQAKNIFDSFNDEIDALFKISLPAGVYSIMKYRFTQTNNIFSYYSSMNFSDDVNLWKDFKDIIPTGPLLDVYQEEIKDTLHLSFSMRGAGVQLAAVSPVFPAETDSRDGGEVHHE